MPKSKSKITPKSKPPISRREKIRQVALDGFVSLGFRGISMAEISRRSKISKPLILYHFRNTDEILIELMHDWAHSGYTMTNEYLEQKLGEPPQVLIAEMLNATFAWIEREPRLARLTPVLLAASHVIPEVKEFSTKAFSRGRERLEQLLIRIPEIKNNHSKNEIKNLSHSLHSLMFGSMLYSLSFGDTKLGNHILQFNQKVIADVIEAYSRSE